MKDKLSILIIWAMIIFSCGQESKSTSVIVSNDNETVNISENQKSVAISNDKYVDTKYVYADSDGKQIIIENSLPKGGLKYADRNGKEYVYAVFWTRITNETDNPFELKIEFPENSYELTSSPGRFFRLFIPSDTMTLDKEPLFNYGLDLGKYLDNNLHKQAELKRIINPNKFSGFYIVTLFNKGVDGTLRTGLSVKEQRIFYRINDREIQCGNINLKKLELNK